MAMKSLGKIMILPKGNYNESTTYEVLDLVKTSTGSYLCKKSCTGISVTNTEYWQEMISNPTKGVDYWTTTDKQEIVEDVLDQVNEFNIDIVEELPTTDIDTHTIYFVPKEGEEQGDIYDEYIYLNNAWEHIGSTSIDLSNYYTKTETDSLLNEFVLELPTYSNLATIMSLNENSTEEAILSAFNCTKTQFTNMLQAIEDSKKIYFKIKRVVPYPDYQGKTGNYTYCSTKIFVDTYYKVTMDVEHEGYFEFYFNSLYGVSKITIQTTVTTDGTLSNAQISINSSKLPMLLKWDTIKEISVPVKSSLYPDINVVGTTTVRDAKNCIKNVKTFYSDLRAGKIMQFIDYETDDSEEVSSYYYPEYTFVSDDLKTAIVIITYDGSKYKLTFTRTSATGTSFSSFNKTIL